MVTTESVSKDSGQFPAVEKYPRFASQKRTTPQRTNPIPDTMFVRVLGNIRFLSTCSRNRETRGMRMMRELDESRRKYAINAFKVPWKATAEIATNKAKPRCLLPLPTCAIGLALAIDSTASNLFTLSCLLASAANFRPGLCHPGRPE